MTFELFRGRGKRGRFGFGVVTIQSSGGIGINDVTYEDLGRPDKALLFFDEAGEKVGIRAADSDEKYAFPIRSSGGSAFSMSVQSFLKYYDIDYSQTKRYRAEKDDDMLVIDLKKPISVRKKTERKADDGESVNRISAVEPENE